MRRFLGVMALLVGCGDNLPCSEAGEAAARYTLVADGITVEIETSPLAVRVVDGDGTEVLASAGDDVALGYTPASWTTGVITTRTFASPGYFSVQAGLDDYRDLEVVGATERGSEVRLHLHEKGTTRTPCVTLSYAVTSSRLRVEARIDDHGDATAPRAWSTGFASAPDEAFLGFGERFNKTNQRGVKVFSWLEEGGIGTGEGMAEGPDNPYPFGEAMAYYPVPFFVSTKGYGFWLDTTWRSQFELATERDDAWRVWHAGPDLAYEVYTRIPDDPRPWPYHLVDSFTRVTGRPMVPPPWAYGPRRRVGAGSMANGMGEIEAMRDGDLAITAVDDALHFYPNGSHVGREAALAAWIVRARALGYRVNGYYNSMINVMPESPLAPRAAEGLANNYFLLDPDGSLPHVWILTGGNLVDLYVVDFTSQAASDWYASSFDWATDIGYSGWMYDFGEYVQPTVVAANGMTGEELHNLYPVLYAKAAHDHLEAGPHAGDWLAFMRAGYTGASQYAPVVWSGDPAASFEDSDGLPSMIPGGVNLGISGAPNFAGDIGGYHCLKDGAAAADGELMARWIQMGALSPVMQDQNACVGGDPAAKANIWNAPDAYDAWKTYARLHTRLFPYLYTLGREAHATGAPIMRHVWFEHPDRTDLAGEDTAYYLGPALYVAPVIERGARTKTVTLPAGTYVDWDTGAVIAGGATVTMDAPLAKLPLLLRAGHLVPLLDPTIDTLAEETSDSIVSPLDVDDVYDVVGALAPGATSAAFTLYDGGTLRASTTGPFTPPSVRIATDDADLASCTACYRTTTLPGGVTRVQITTGPGAVEAGGLHLESATKRRIRWDLYLLP
jgi:alpha-glucosidase